MPSNAFITGAASGIGRATAQLFAQRGWRVGLADRDAEGVAALAAELGEERAMACPCDVTNPASLQRTLDQFCGPGGALELLVNNAGLLHIGPFEEMPPAAHRELIEVNARGVVEVLLAAFPALARARGAVVNLSSASACYGSPDYATYSASKMFVRGLSEALDIEWRRHGIRVACIMPAFVSTPMIEGWRSNAMDRLGVQLRPEDVAEVIWKAAHGRRLTWHVGWRYRALRALSEPLPAGVKRTMMRWVSGYPGRTG
ncbi:SDR family oxidoreductase [Thioalkalivibrio sp. XN279]|uniref:SDR family oxidoreductase n=1 Tax=Thioalkalivibrio sp. XN279 TaxID=2714953 RepID=UPI00140DD12C|nr:SDR family oxidoreductase [Thioalkalivibrio sp. XN279]NHA14375.1 SDR family oxidoreductase [Thioalkalivibrio sp. XN279]